MSLWPSRELLKSLQAPLVASETIRWGMHMHPNLTRRPEEKQPWILFKTLLTKTRWLKTRVLSYLKEFSHLNWMLLWRIRRWRWVLKGDIEVLFLTDQKPAISSLEVMERIGIILKSESSPTSTPSTLALPGHALTPKGCLPRIDRQRGPRQRKKWTRPHLGTEARKNI